MIRNRLALLVPAAVVLAAAVGGTAAVVGPNETDRTCTRTTVDLGDGSAVDVVVLVDGRSSASVSQRVVQSDDRSAVHVEVRYEDGSLTISGETAADGRLVLTATRDGTAATKEVAVHGSDDRAVVLYVDEDGDLRVGRAGGEDLCSAEFAGSDLNVSTDDSKTDATDGSRVDVESGDSDDAVYETDGGRSGDCPAADVCTCSASSTEITSPPRRSSVESEVGVDVFRVLTRSNVFAGLAKPNLADDCEASGEASADPADLPLKYEPGDEV